MTRTEDRPDAVAHSASQAVLDADDARQAALRDLAEAELAIGLAATAGERAAAVDHRNDLEADLAPLTDADCRVVDRHFHLMRRRPAA